MLKHTLKDTLDSLQDIDKRFTLGALDCSEITDISENVDSLKRLDQEINELLETIHVTEKKHELLELFMQLHKQLLVRQFYLDQVTSMIEIVLWKLDLKPRFKD